MPRSAGCSKQQGWTEKCADARGSTDREGDAEKEGLKTIFSAAEIVVEELDLWNLEKSHVAQSKEDDKASCNNVDDSLMLVNSSPQRSCKYS